MAQLLAGDTKVGRPGKTYTCGLIAMARVGRRVGWGD